MRFHFTTCYIYAAFENMCLVFSLSLSLYIYIYIYTWMEMNRASIGGTMHRFCADSCNLDVQRNNIVHGVRKTRALGVTRAFKGLPHTCNIPQWEEGFWSHFDTSWTPATTAFTAWCKTCRNTWVTLSGDQSNRNVVMSFAQTKWLFFQHVLRDIRMF